jgi:streptogramin lyase
MSMNGNNFTRLPGSKRNLIVLLASTVAFTAGCSNMVTTATSSTALSTAATIGGRIHGGSQPITGAAVTLYYAGDSGYGSGLTQGGKATIAATTTTDSSGSFSFSEDPTPNDTTSGNTFSCPVKVGNVNPPAGVENNPLVYVIARGGNTLNTGDSTVSNSAAVFLGVFGLCQSILPSNFIEMNEVTTVASIAALQQYFNPVTESIGTDGIGVAKTALVNTLGTIANLANVATGTALSSTVVNGGSGDGASGVQVTVTAPALKINQIANILAACVNNPTADATPCQTLFTYATPPNVVQTDRPYQSSGFPAATDTLQAAYYMLSNPTNGSTDNLKNLFGLATGVGSPFQPALLSAPSDWSLTLSYSSASNCGASSGSFISGPQDINIDGSGNVWLANGQATIGNLSSISSNGTPNACVFLGGGSSRGSTIDSQGNIWYGTAAANNIYRYNPSNHSILSYTTAAPPLAVTADGSGNVYFSTAPDGSLYQLPVTETQTTQIASSSTAPTQIATSLGSIPSRLAADINGAIWVTSGSSYVSQVAPPSASYNTTGKYLTTTFGTSGGNSYGVAISQAINNIFSVVVSSEGTKSGLSYLTGSGITYNTAASWPTPAALGGLSNPTAIAIDPQFNIWAPNNTGSASLSEIGVAASGLTPYTDVPSGFQQGTDFPGGGRAVVIDMSGNVWYAGDGTSTTPANFVTEVVGAGAPVYQPFAVGLSNQRFQTIP